MGTEGALASIRSGVEVLNDVALWSRTEDQALSDVRECWNLLQRLEAAYTAMVADLETRVLPEGLSTKALLRSALHRTIGQAASDVRAAKNPLPECGAVFKAGAMSRAHLDVIVKTIALIPEALLQGEVPPSLPELAGDGGPVTLIRAIDVYFAHWAPLYDSQQVQFLAKSLLAALDPDGDDGFDEDAYERRGETHARDDAGMLFGSMNLDAAAGTDFAAAIDHLSAPHPTRTEVADDGTTVQIKDTRTPGQRRADAVGLMARLAMGAADAGTRGGEPPRVVLYTGIQDYHDLHCPDPTHHHPSAPEPPTAPAPAAPAPAAPAPDVPAPDAPAPDAPAPAATNPPVVEPPAPALPAPELPEPPAPAEPRGQTFWGRRHGGTDTHLGAIGPRLLARLCCDAVLQVALMHPTGAILNLGRDTRTITPTQRRALNARDRGCIIPGCTAPAAWCDGHHVTYWEHGGLTNLDNLALLCGQHHTAVHLGLWTLKMINGIPWAQPSRHIDPHQRWIRNTYRDDLDTARGLGAQLRLPVEQPPPEDEPPLTTDPPDDAG